MLKPGCEIDYRNFSNTPRLIKDMLVRANQLLRATLRKDVSVTDTYQALAMASELLDDIDRLFCAYHYDEIPNKQSQRSFEELTGKIKISRSSKKAVGGASTG